MRSPDNVLAQCAVLPKPAASYCARDSRRCTICKTDLATRAVFVLIVLLLQPAADWRGSRCASHPSLCGTHLLCRMRQDCRGTDTGSSGLMEQQCSPFTASRTAVKHSSTLWLTGPAEATARNCARPCEPHTDVLCSMHEARDTWPWYLPFVVPRHSGVPVSAYCMLVPLGACKCALFHSQHASILTVLGQRMQQGL